MKTGIGHAEALPCIRQNPVFYLFSRRLAYLLVQKVQWKSLKDFITPAHFTCQAQSSIHLMKGSLFLLASLRVNNTKMQIFEKYNQSPRRLLPSLQFANPAKRSKLCNLAIREKSQPSKRQHSLLPCENSNVKALVKIWLQCFLSGRHEEKVGSSPGDTQHVFS